MLHAQATQAGSGVRTGQALKIIPRRSVAPLQGSRPSAGWSPKHGNNIRTGSARAHSVSAGEGNTENSSAPVPVVAPELRHFDFLVLGSGIAGLSFALKVADYGTVAIITKAHIMEGCTQYAQGGVCSVLDASDSVASHMRDTIVAGAFLNDINAVEVVCREGPALVLELAEFGARFTRNSDGSLHLTREGGHSNRRIVHADDLTGREIERALVEQAERHTNISIFDHHLAVDLITEEFGGMQHCFGADVLNRRAGTITRFVALATMLASGGAGQLYPNTTNPLVATGDGIAMAYRAGATVANLEFVQFHPTALYVPPVQQQGRTFLITGEVGCEV